MANQEIIGDPYKLADGTVLPLSRAVRAGDFVFLSGQLGFDKNGQLVGDGIADQTRQAIENISEVLKEAGGDISDIVKITVWLTTTESFAEFNHVYGEHFSSIRPVRCTVCSGLMVPGALVEIEATAYLPTEK